MKWFRLMCLAAVAGQLVGSGAAADRAATNPEGLSLIHISEPTRPY